MNKLLLSLLFVPCLLWAEGPQFVGPSDGLVYPEFNNVYYQLRNPKPFVYLSSATTASGSFGASTVYVDLASLSLSKGKWECSANMRAGRNGATLNGLSMFIGGTVAGNNATGYLQGDNASDFNYVAYPGTEQQLVVPSYRIVLSVATTIYMKIEANYTVAVPMVDGFRFSCITIP